MEFATKQERCPGAYYQMCARKDEKRVDLLYVERGWDGGVIVYSHVRDGMVGLLW